MSTQLQKTNQDLDALKHLSSDELQEAKQLAQALDVRDSLAVMGFGVKPHQELAALTDPILRAVRTGDTGAAGEVLTELLGEIKSLNGASLADQVESGVSKLPLVSRVFDKLHQFISQYEKVSVKIDRTVTALGESKRTLTRDIAMLDQLYAQNTNFFRQLLTYVAAGHLKLEALRAEYAALAETARSSGDMLDAQNLSDLSNAMMRLERRVHDLKLGAVVALQSAPQIRLVQDGDQALVEKIQSSILTTIPLWKSQVVIAIALFDQKKSAELQKQIAKTTNDLLIRNADMLQQSTKAVVRESERGIVAIETIRQVNQKLIDTIQETIEIQKAGHARRMEVEAELEVLEKELQATLSRVRD